MFFSPFDFHLCLWIIISINMNWIYEKFEKYLPNFSEFFFLQKIEPRKYFGFLKEKKNAETPVSISQNFGKCFSNFSKIQFVFTEVICFRKLGIKLNFCGVKKKFSFLIHFIVSMSQNLWSRLWKELSAI
jgi:hypothetical protein